MDDLVTKGGVSLSRRYLRSVISTMSARVKRSSTVLIAFRTSSINIRRPQCTSSGQEQRANLLEEFDRQFFFRGQLACLEHWPAQFGGDSEIDLGAKRILAAFGQLHTLLNQ